MAIAVNYFCLMLKWLKQVINQIMLIWKLFFQLFDERWSFIKMIKYILFTFWKTGIVWCKHWYHSITSIWQYQSFHPTLFRKWYVKPPKYSVYKHLELGNGKSLETGNAECLAFCSKQICDFPQINLDFCFSTGWIHILSSWNRTHPGDIFSLFSDGFSNPSLYPSVHSSSVSEHGTGLAPVSTGPC